MRAALSIFVFAALTARAEMPAIQQVSARLAETKSRELEGLRNYTVLRHYVLTTEGGHSAEMMVRLTYSRPGLKQFDVLWERGSTFIQRRVFHKLLEAEEDASRHDVRVTPDNYSFRLEGIEAVNGRRCYVLGLTPRVHKKYLLRGRAWVDAADFAVVKVEGEPVESSSFWIRSSHMVLDYRKVGRFWLPALTQSTSEVRIFGPAHLSIESLDYQINRSHQEDRAEILSVRPPVE